MSFPLPGTRARAALHSAVIQLLASGNISSSTRGRAALGLRLGWWARAHIQGGSQRQVCGHLAHTRVQALRSRFPQVGTDIFQEALVYLVGKVLTHKAALRDQGPQSKCVTRVCVPARAGRGFLQTACLCYFSNCRSHPLAEMLSRPFY